MRRALLFVLVAGLGLLTGCVTFHSTIVIEPNGSGTCTLNYSVSESVKEALAEAGSMGGEGKDMPSIEDFKREDMEKRAKENGVTITSFDHQTADGRETLAIGMKFKDVTGLSRVMHVVGGDGGVMAILRNTEGNYVLTSIPDPNPPADEPEEPAEKSDVPATPEDPAKAMELMGKLMQSISELDVRMEITVPGDVLSSSAPAVEGRTSVWAINAANMMEAQNMSMEPEITFSKQGVNIDAPTRQE
jgi:hypothetical protein